MNFGAMFPGKEPDERILLALRRHWYIPFLRIMGFAFAAFVPGVLLLAAAYVGHPFVLDARNLGSVLAVLGLSVYELATWIVFYVAWLNYELDIFIVTDRRIVNIAQNGLFNRAVSEQRLSRVQDVTSEVKGVLPTFLGFGTVYVQTAGEKEHFIFHNVPKPEDLAKVIQMQLDKIEDRLGTNPSGAGPAATPRSGTATPVTVARPRRAR